MSNSPFDRKINDSLYSVLLNNNYSIKDTFNQNGKNILRHSESHRNYSNLFSSNIKPSSINFLTRINNLESKLSILEKTNFNLQNKLKESENFFENRLKQIEMKINKNEINYNQNENLISNKLNKNSLSSNEINEKIIQLENFISKENEFKSNQVELQKKIVNKLTNQISETIKLEISSRLEGDIKNKIENENLNNSYLNKIDNLKYNYNEIIYQLKKDIVKNSNECSERSHNLSKYIDMKISEILNNKDDKLKYLIDEIEKIKNNFLIQDDKNLAFDNRINNLENFIKFIKDDIYKFISKVEERLISKMKDIKLFNEINIKKLNEYIKKKFIIFSNENEKNMIYLGEQIAETRTEINNEFNRINKKEIEKFEYLSNDMESICNRIYKYEDILKKYDKENHIIKNEINKFLYDFNSKIEILFVNEKIIHNIEMITIREEINKIIKSLNLQNQSINNKIKDNQTNPNEMIEIIQKINTLENKLKNQNEKYFNLIDTLKKNQDIIEVKLIMDEISSKVESSYLFDSIENIKKNNFNNNILNVNKDKKEEKKNDLNEKNDEKYIEEINSLKKELNNQSNANNLKFNTIKESILKIKSEIKYDIVQELNKNSEIRKLENKFTFQQILNNVEFKNIYSLIKKGVFEENKNIKEINIDNVIQDNLNNDSKKALNISVISDITNNEKDKNSIESKKTKNSINNNENHLKKILKDKSSFKKGNSLKSVSFKDHDDISEIEKDSDYSFNKNVINKKINNDFSKYEEDEQNNLKDKNKSSSKGILKKIDITSNKSIPNFKNKK